MFTTRHLNTKARKKQLYGKKSSKKIKNKNEKENGRHGDNRAVGRRQDSGLRRQEIGDRNKEKEWKGKLLRVLRI